MLHSAIRFFSGRVRSKKNKPSRSRHEIGNFGWVGWRRLERLRERSDEGKSKGKTITPLKTSKHKKKKQTPHNQPPQTKHVMKHLNKNNFLPCSRTVHYFHRFSFFVNIHLFYCNCCALLESQEKCFQQSTALEKTKLATTTSSPTPQKHLKRCHSGFAPFPLQPIFLLCSLGKARTLKKRHLAKTDSVHENAVVFSLPSMNSVLRILPQKSDFSAFSCLMTTLKKHYSYNLVWVWHFFCFIFLANRHTKQQLQKCTPQSEKKKLCF